MIRRHYNRLCRFSHLQRIILNTRTKGERDSLSRVTFWSTIYLGEMRNRLSQGENEQKE